MLTIRIFDSRGRLIRQVKDIPDDATPAIILDHVSQTETEEPHQSFSARVENEQGKGYWVLLGELTTPKIEHPRCRERKN